MSPEEGVEILRKEMKDRSDEDKRVLRGGQAHVTEQLRLSDEIQQHRDAIVIDTEAPCSTASCDREGEGNHDS